MSAAALGVLMLVAAWVAVPEARAQSLADPTRPPAAGAEQEGEAAPAGKQLQSVLFSRGRKLAVIDGTMVPLGGEYGDARVVKITETEVVLKQGEETETLKLFPGVDKQAVRRASARARAGEKAEGSMPQGGAK
jgi:MSHA biogenesis protein MshK